MKQVEPVGSEWKGFPALLVYICSESRKLRGSLERGCTGEEERWGWREEEGSLVVQSSSDKLVERTWAIPTVALLRDGHIGYLLSVGSSTVPQAKERQQRSEKELGTASSLQSSHLLTVMGVHDGEATSHLRVQCRFASCY